MQEQGVKVTPGKDRIEVKGQKVSVASAADAAQRLVYFAVNKPKGFVCSNIDAKGSGKRCVDILQPWLDTWARNNKDKVIYQGKVFHVPCDICIFHVACSSDAAACVRMLAC